MMSGHQHFAVSRALESVSSSTFVAARYKGWEIRCTGLNSPYISHWTVNYTQCEQSELVVWNERYGVVIDNHIPREIVWDMMAPVWDDIKTGGFALTIEGPVFVPDFMVSRVVKRLSAFLPLPTLKGLVPVYYTTRILTGWYWGTPVYQILLSLPDTEPALVQGDMSGYKLGEDFLANFSGLYRHSGSIYDHFWREERTPEVPYGVDGKIAVFSCFTAGDVIRSHADEDVIVEESGLYVLVHQHQIVED